MNIKKLLVAASLFTATMVAYAADEKATKNTSNEPQALNPNGQNSTAVGRDGAQLAPEMYTFSLRAPLIDNHTFPVPVEYFDALLKPGTHLKATLNVPLRLKVENSRARRLFTIISLHGDQEVPFGSKLKNVSQIALQSLNDADSKHTALVHFVGPNRRVYRAIKDGDSFAINFILPITHMHFHNGYVKIAMASTNGVEVDTACEITSTNCVKPVIFRIVPRHIEYTENFTGVSKFEKIVPTLAAKVTKTNADLDLYINGKDAHVKLDRHALPESIAAEFIRMNFDLHRYSRAKKPTHYIHFDFYPHIYYMSNNSYKIQDVLTTTFAVSTPSFYTRNDKRATPVLKALYELDNVAPFTGGEVKTEEKAKEDSEADSEE